VDDGHARAVPVAAKVVVVVWDSPGVRRGSVLHSPSLRVANSSVGCGKGYGILRMPVLYGFFSEELLHQRFSAAGNTPFAGRRKAMRERTLSHLPTRAHRSAQPL